MALWGNLDASNNAPNFSGITGYDTSTTGQSLANSQTTTIFNNVTIGATQSGAVLGVFAVDTTEIADVSVETHSGAHAGWIARHAGTGPITSITANAAAVAVNSFITFAGGSLGAAAGVTGNTAANARVSVNSTGHIVSIAVGVGGSYANTPVISGAASGVANVYTGLTYVENTSPISTSSYSNAVFTIVMGGRANRVQQETLVAMGSMYGDSGGNPYP
jgi:hypothetical protein